MELIVEREQFWLGRYDAPQPFPEQGPCFAAWIRGEYSLLAPRLPGRPGSSQGPWACLGVSGTLDLSLVGVMERLSRCLAELSKESGAALAAGRYQKFRRMGAAPQKEEA